MELGCVVMLFGVPIMIWWFIEYIRDQSKTTTSPIRRPPISRNLLITMEMSR